MSIAAGKRPQPAPGGAAAAGSADEWLGRVRTAGDGTARLQVKIGNLHCRPSAFARAMNRRSPTASGGYSR